MIRAFLKSLAYRSGTLGAYHRARNRDHLTVVMFHRVLSRKDPRWEHANPEWTVSDHFFAACLDFFSVHYNLIPMSALLEWQSSKSNLPAYPLLVTFDDGWSDVYDYALEHLRRRALPSAHFLVANEIGGYEPWQDFARTTWRDNPPIIRDAGWPWYGGSERDNCRGQRSAIGHGVDGLIDLWSRIPAEERAVRIARLRKEAGHTSSRQLMSREQVLLLRSSQGAIGSHGLTHTSIPSSENPWEELSGSRQWLSSLLGNEAGPGPTAFSFPNGCYDAKSLALAAKAGYRLLFTSEPYLTALPSDRGQSLVMGRINIPAEQLGDDRGRLRPELLALWLFSRPAIKRHAR